MTDKLTTLFLSTMLLGCGSDICENYEEGSLEYQAFCYNHDEKQEIEEAPKATLPQPVSKQLPYCLGKDCIEREVSQDTVDDCEEEVDEIVAQQEEEPGVLYASDNFNKLNTDRWVQCSLDGYDVKKDANVLEISDNKLVFKPTEFTGRSPFLLSKFKVTSLETEISMDLKINTSPNAVSEVLVGFFPASLSDEECFHPLRRIYSKLRLENDGQTNAATRTYDVDGPSRKIINTVFNRYSVGEWVNVKIQRNLVGYASTILFADNTMVASDTIDFSEFADIFQQDDLRVVVYVFNNDDTLVDIEVDNFVINENNIEWLTFE